MSDKTDKAQVQADYERLRRTLEEWYRAAMADDPDAGAKADAFDDAFREWLLTNGGP